MMRWLLDRLRPEDWKRGVALVVLYAYAYQLVIWAPLAWLTTLVAALSGAALPVPPIVPWEHLLTGTTTLATIGGISAWKDQIHLRTEGAQP
jgi:hypothetical protein